jgi:hypothetical protein
MWKAAVKVLAFVALAALAYPVKAADKITYDFFEHPVEIPGGKILPPGEYAFKMVDESAPVKVVQILLALPAGTVGVPSTFSTNPQMKVAATLAAVTDYRNRKGRGTATYWQVRGGGPNALRGLNFPLDSQNLLFVYPQARAAELAKAANQAVPSAASVPSDDANALKTLTVKATNANGQDVATLEAFGKPGDHPPTEADRPTGVHFPPGCVYEAGEVSCQYNPGETRD